MKENLTSLLDISPVIGAINTYDDLKKIILTDIKKKDIFGQLFQLVEYFSYERELLFIIE